MEQGLKLPRKTQDSDREFIWLIPKLLASAGLNTEATL